MFNAFRKVTPLEPPPHTTTFLPARFRLSRFMLPFFHFVFISIGKGNYVLFHSLDIILVWVSVCTISLSDKASIQRNCPSNVSYISRTGKSARWKYMDKRTDTGNTSSAHRWGPQMPRSLRVNAMVRHFKKNSSAGSVSCRTSACQIKKFAGWLNISNTCRQQINIRLVISIALQIIILNENYTLSIRVAVRSRA